MNRQSGFDLISLSKPEQQARFNVTGLAMFDSTALYTASSYVEATLAVDGPPTSNHFAGVQFCLEGLPGCPFDLVTKKTLRSLLRNYIECVSAVEMIKRLSKNHLLYLYRLIIHPSKFIFQILTTTEVTTLTKGDKVIFPALNSGLLEGLLLSLVQSPGVVQ